MQWVFASVFNQRRTLIVRITARYHCCAKVIIPKNLGFPSLTVDFKQKSQTTQFAFFQKRSPQSKMLEKPGLCNRGP
jgi:hypothetical protein